MELTYFCLATDLRGEGGTRSDDLSYGSTG